MINTQNEVEKLRTLQESFHDFVEEIGNMNATYEHSTGKLTINNVRITIK